MEALKLDIHFKPNKSGLVIIEIWRIQDLAIIQN